MWKRRQGVELTGTNWPMTCHLFFNILVLVCRVHYMVPEKRPGILCRPVRAVWGVGVFFDGVSVVIAVGERPVPFRTRKLSLSAPMVLPG